MFVSDDFDLHNSFQSVQHGLCSLASYCKKSRKMSSISPITLMFYRRIGNSTSETPVKFQSGFNLQSHSF